MRRAFTLIEILIVIALSAVLFALLLVPLVNGIKYARQAQSLTAAQDAARITRERIERELGSAVYVFDNTSHPFQLAAGKQYAAGDDKFTNFLDLDVPQKPNPAAGGPYTTAVAHAYNAKLDFVLPRLNDKGNPIDPTTNDPISISTSVTTNSPIISDPTQIFPAAAGTSLVRYWVGRKDPTQPYNNTREERTSESTDNMYVLYRAQCRLSNDLDPVTNKPIVNADGTTINEKLFVPKHDAAGNAINQPELDDPDFFRYVNQPGATDVNWLDQNHAGYPTQNVGGTPGSPATHNSRVDKWMSIAKPVIPGPNVDLVLMPHASDGTLLVDKYADETGYVAGADTKPGVAHYGLANDPIKQVTYPIVNTSVTFRPGVVSGDATPATTTEYNSAGVVASDGATNAAYVPTAYTTGSQSWAQPYVVTLVPPTVATGQSAGGATYYVQQDPVSSDYYEYRGASPNGTAVFDVTTGAVLSGVSYVPLTINAQTGTISFATPALPKPPTPKSGTTAATLGDPYNRQWVYQPATPSLDLKDIDSNGKTPPLATAADPTLTDTAGNPLLLARVVPGSLRVYGPDMSQGPGKGQPVLYTEARPTSSDSTTAAGDNQFTVDYTTGILTFTGADAIATFNGSAAVNVIYDYQANAAPVGTVTSGKMQIGYGLLPLSVQVDYQTRDLIDVAIGVRIYDLTTGRAQVIPAETKVKIGNSNR